MILLRDRDIDNIRTLTKLRTINREDIATSRLTNQECAGRILAWWNRQAGTTNKHLIPTPIIVYPNRGRIVPIHRHVRGLSIRNHRDLNNSPGNHHSLRHKVSPIEVHIDPIGTEGRITNIRGHDISTVEDKPILTTTKRHQATTHDHLILGIPDLIRSIGGLNTNIRRDVSPIIPERHIDTEAILSLSSTHGGPDSRRYGVYGYCYYYCFWLVELFC